MASFTVKKLPSTELVRRLSHNLLNSVGNCPAYVCVDTGVVIEPSTEYMVAYGMNDRAMGAHYEAFGFFYILCFDMEDYEEYVAVHDSKGKLMGTIINSDAVQVGLWTGR